MPQTKIELDQTVHIGSSGTLVSDEELIDASGALQQNINNLGDTFLGLASGVFEDTIHILNSKGEETNSKPRTKFDIPVNEYVKSGQSSTYWNARVPLGGLASGVIFLTAFFVENPAAASGRFELNIKPLSVGDDVSAVTSLIQTVDIDMNVPANTAQIIQQNINITPSQRFFSMKFSRLGNLDSFQDSIFVVAHGVQFRIPE